MPGARGRKQGRSGRRGGRWRDRDEGRQLRAGGRGGVGDAETEEKTAAGWEAAEGAEVAEGRRAGWAPVRAPGAGALAPLPAPAGVARVCLSRNLPASRPSPTRTCTGISPSTQGECSSRPIRMHRSVSSLSGSCQPQACSLGGSEGLPELPPLRVRTTGGLEETLPTFPFLLPAVSPPFLLVLLLIPSSSPRCSWWEGTGQAPSPGRRSWGGHRMQALLPLRQAETQDFFHIPLPAGCKARIYLVTPLLAWHLFK